MGQSKSNTNKLVNQWTFIDNLGKFEIFKNQQNQLAQKHIVRADPKIDESDYITAYHQRYLPNKPIVNAYDVQFEQRSKSMCQNVSTFTVFTQFIPYRLSDVKTLNHGQGIYVLSEALAGFAELYQRVGPFQINEDLIGFNQEGQVRVWYNPNFADNSVDNDRIILMSTVNPYDFDRKFSQNQQHDMVEDTINAVARYTRFHPNFLKQAEHFKRTSFAQIRRILTNQIGRKAYYVPDHLFLGDRNDIIKKSGVQLRHKDVLNPNKPKKGERYPYFLQGQSVQQGQTHYLQGQPPYPQYNYNYDDQSQTQSNSDVYNGQGYYNMNGQNYRVLETRQIQGGHINQQALIEEITRNVSNNQQHNYGQNPNYVLTKSGVNNNQVLYDNRSDTSSQYRRKHPKYQEGHIVINDGSYHRKPKNQFTYGQTNNMYQHPQQQQTVRVFQIGQDGRLQQHHNHNLPQPHYSLSNYQAHSTVHPHYQPQNTRVVINDPVHYYVQPSRYPPHLTPYPQNHSLYPPTNINVHPPPQSNQSITHRHRIFQPVHTPHQSLIKEEPQLAPQRAF